MSQQTLYSGIHNPITTNQDQTLRTMLYAVIDIPATAATPSRSSICNHDGSTSLVGSAANMDRLVHRMGSVRIDFIRHLARRPRVAQGPEVAL